jgi:hypothetical protein
VQRDGCTPSFWNLEKNSLQRKHHATMSSPLSLRANGSTLSHLKCDHRAISLLISISMVLTSTPTGVESANVRE